MRPFMDSRVSNNFFQECSDVERWVVEDVEREEEEEKCSDEPKPFCWEIQVPSILCFSLQVDLSPKSKIGRYQC